MQTHLRLGEFDTRRLACSSSRWMISRDRELLRAQELNEAYLIAHVRDHARNRHLHMVRPIMLRTSRGVLHGVPRGRGLPGPSHAELSARPTSNVAWTRGQSRFLRLERLLGGYDFADCRSVVRAQAILVGLWRFRLEGRPPGPGTQAYVPSRDGDAAGGLCHTALFYEAEGRLFDEQVAGIVIIEQAFSPPGRILGDSAVRRRFGGGWNGFASVFEDGSFQYGHLTCGRGPFRYANIVDGGRHISCPVAPSLQTGATGLGRVSSIGSSTASAGVRRGIERCDARHDRARVAAQEYRAAPQGPRRSRRRESAASQLVFDPGVDSRAPRRRRQRGRSGAERFLIHAPGTTLAGPWGRARHSTRTRKPGPHDVEEQLLVTGEPVITSSHQEDVDLSRAAPCKLRDGGRRDRLVAQTVDNQRGCRMLALERGRVVLRSVQHQTVADLHIEPLVDEPVRPRCCASTASTSAP